MNRNTTPRGRETHCPAPPLLAAVGSASCSFLHLALLAIISLPLAGCSRERADSDDSAAAPDATPVPVQVAMARVVTLQPKLELVGTLVAIPERTAMVSPQVGGWVEKLAVVEGQIVKTNDLLVQFDDRLAQTEVARAKALVAEKESALQLLKHGYLPEEIETARRDRDKVQATVDGLRSELAALDDLLQRQEISPVAYEMKAEALKASEAALASAEAHLKLLEEGTRAELIDEAQAVLDAAEADLEHAQLSLAWCSITSPIDGVVVKLQARQGQFVDRAAALATVMDLTDIFVQLRLPSQQFGKTLMGTPVEVHFTSLPERTYRGAIERISGEADPLTGNVVIFGILKNDDLLLRPGLSCQAQLSLQGIPNALAVPVAAVADHSGTPVVTVIRNGKAYETEVDTGVATRDFVQILDGLTAGDVVATAGGYGLPDGCPVSVSPDAKEAGTASD